MYGRYSSARPIIQYPLPFYVKSILFMRTLLWERVQNVNQYNPNLVKLIFISKNLLLCIMYNVLFMRNLIWDRIHVRLDLWCLKSISDLTTFELLSLQNMTDSWPIFCKNIHVEGSTINGPVPFKFCMFQKKKFSRLLEQILKIENFRIESIFNVVRASVKAYQLYQILLSYCVGWI